MAGKGAGLEALAVRVALSEVAMPVAPVARARVGEVEVARVVKGSAEAEALARVGAGARARVVEVVVARVVRGTAEAEY